MIGGLSEVLIMLALSKPFLLVINLPTDDFKMSNDDNTTIASF